MDQDSVRNGLRVRTAAWLKEKSGLGGRSTNKPGVVIQHHPTICDIWWVKHEDTSVGGYHPTELEPI